jgi:hypothetical protein
MNRIIKLRVNYTLCKFDTFTVAQVFGLFMTEIAASLQYYR